MSRRGWIGALVGLVVWLAIPATAQAAAETTPELIAILESDASVQEKAIACRKLGEFGTAEAVPALAVLLEHEVLAAYARSGLERIPDPSASAALRAALGTTEGSLRVGVITSLGALRDEEAVGALVELARVEDASVAKAALLALGRMTSPVAVEAVKASLTEGRPGADTAGLLAAETQRDAGHADVALALYDAVRAANVAMPSRLGATRGAILTRGSVPFLMEQLESDDPAIRDVALLAIREMASPTLADALHARLATAPADLRVLLITALPDCHNEASFGVVKAQLESDDPATRRAALSTLSTVGQGKELASTLLDVVQARRSPIERQTAMGLLERMEGGQTVDEVILARLQGTDSTDMRIDAIRVLGQRRSPTAVDDLLEQAGNDDPRVRVAALRAMRRTVGPANVPALITLLEAEASATARTAGVQALVSACGSDEAAGQQVLDQLKSTSDPTEKDVWVRVLTATGYPEALPTVLEGLRQSDPELVAATITHLSRWPDPSPIDALLPFLKEGADPDLQRRAVPAVIQLTRNAADREQRPEATLVEWLGLANAAVENVAEKRLLLSGLAQVHTVGSLRLLAPYLDDPEVKTEALYALLSVGSPLVKAGHREEVARVLPEEATTDSNELRWRISLLRKQVEEAETSG